MAKLEVISDDLQTRSFVTCLTSKINILKGGKLTFTK